MKKRIFALALALCMMLSAMPTSFAGNGFLTLDGQENVEEQPREQQQEGILTLDDPDVVITQEPEEEPVYGVLTPDTPSEEPKAPVVEQSEGVLYVECPECGYLDGYHADDCPTIQPEEQEPVRQPETSLPAEDVPVVSTYSAENVSSAQTARTLTVVRNASTYNLLRNSLMSVYDTRDGASTQAEVEQKDAEGLVTSKDVNDDDKDGIYTVTLEAYTTGEVKTSTKTIPVDIVLVLDQSESMAYDFDGYSTSSNTARRQYAMKQAVNNFVSSVSEKYSEDADHRISIVTFSSEAETLQGWTDVDEVGKTTLQEKISGLPDSPSGVTNISAGMGFAKDLMDSGYNYTRTNTQRQKVVVVFTDGVPTTRTDFDTGVATNAIASAKNLKDAGATVYTVGIFTGADPSQLHGDKFDRWIVADDPCNGNVGEYWGYTNLNAWVVGGEETIRGLDIAATNRFMNFLSSNFSVATEIGIESYSSGLAGGVAWRITKNFTRTASDYYLTANDGSSLNQIFQTISQTIQTPSIDLGSTTEVRDVISPYFDLPENVSESHIKLYTAAAKADGTFEDRVPDPSGVAATISSDHKTVSVTGFDFNANFVSKTAKEDGSYGKKLIITFDIVPNYDTTLGGSGIASNGDDSGIYSDGTVIEHFYRPTVDVKTDTITPTVRDQNIYLSNPADLSKLLAETDSRINGSGNAGVDVTYTLYQVGDDGNDTAIATLEIPAGKSATGYKWTAESGQNLNPELDSCTEYYIVCEVVATENDKNATEGESSKTWVHVYKPEVTFKDSTIYLSQTPDYAENYVSVVWKDDGTPATEAMGDAPTLVYDYNPANDFTDCTDVDVAVAVDQGKNDENETVLDGEYDERDVNITTHVTFVNGANSHAGSVEAKEFTVHVLKPSFTVTCADLWADYGQSITLDGAINASDDTIDYYISTAIEGWTDAKGHTGIPAADESKKPADTAFAYTYSVKQGEQEVTEHNVGTTDKTFTVELTSFNIGTFKGGTNWYTAPVAKTFTVFVNKFDLTITKNWADVEDCYKQDVIFTITGDYGTGENQNIQVVIPVGKTSVKVVGLLCGQSYSVAEANPEGINWAWRFTNTQKPNVTCNVKHDVISTTEHLRHTVNADFINSNPATKWFDAIASKFNIFRKGGN